MKRILAITTAALMSFGAAGYASAQATGIDTGGNANVGVGAGPDTGVEAGAGAGVGVGTGIGAGTTGTRAGTTGGTTAGTTAGTTGSIGAAGDANLGSVVSSINSGQLGTSELRVMTEVSSVNVVRIGEMPGGEEQQAINQALDRHQMQIDDLRAEIDTRAELQSALQAEGVSSGDVVAAQVHSDGSVTVFVR